MFSNYLLLEANECCGTCDILLKKCILHCLDGPKFHRFDTFRPHYAIVIVKQDECRNFVNIGYS